jgi:uncharacterized protein YecT (DUF1311 family)
MRSLIVAAGALLVLTTPPAHAQKRPVLDGPTQPEINAQASQRFSMADEQLNAAYAKLMVKASPDGRERLRAAQRAWVAFRDLDCEARAGSRGGSFHPAAVLLCREALTDERTRALKDELACEESDLGCGGVSKP